MALQAGTELETGKFDVTLYEKVQILDAGYVQIKHTPVSPPNYVYWLNSDGSIYKSYELSQSLGYGQFVYNNQIIYFDSDAPYIGEFIGYSYTYSILSNAQRLKILVDAIPSIVWVSCSGIARDVCSGETFPCTLEGLAQIGGNWSFDLSSDGEAVTQNISLEFIRNCLNKTLYTFIVCTQYVYYGTIDEVAPLTIGEVSLLKIRSIVRPH